MKTHRDNKVCYRLDVRGTNGKVTRVRALEREGSGKFFPIKRHWTTADAVQFRQLAKVASTFAKGIAPPLDADEILRKVNKSGSPSLRLDRKPRRPHRGPTKS